MIRNVLKLIVCLVAGGFLLAGCGKEQTDDTAAKSYEEYKKEPQKEITVENAVEELDKIEQEMAAESN